jgi:hypothetical protein
VLVLALYETDLSGSVRMLILDVDSVLGFTLSPVCIIELRNGLAVVGKALGLAPTDLVGPAAALEEELETLLVLNLGEGKRGTDVLGTGAVLNHIEVLETVVVAGLGAGLAIEEQSLGIVSDENSDSGEPGIHISVVADTLVHKVFALAVEVRLDTAVVSFLLLFEGLSVIGSVRHLVKDFRIELLDPGLAAIGIVTVVGDKSLGEVLTDTESTPTTLDG